MTRDRELWAIVMERFPKLEKERSCRLEREMREYARESFYNRLYEQKAKGELLEAKHTNNS